MCGATLDIEDVAFYQAPTGAAVCPRPIWRRPTALVERACPAGQLRFTHALAQAHTFGDVRWQGFGQERSYFGPQRGLLFAKRILHPYRPSYPSITVASITR